MEFKSGVEDDVTVLSSLTLFPQTQKHLDTGRRTITHKQRTRRLRLEFYTEVT